MSSDISHILENWPEGESNVRRIVGDDGREKVQIRVCINSFHGVVQFECDGRPDGKQSHGRPFALDYYEEQLRQTGKGFILSHKQAEELFEESSMTYQRYVLLLQMGDFKRVIRDTERNMRVFRFVHRHAENEDDRMALEKWWPYILRIHATAVTLNKLQDKDYAGALDTVSAAREQIKVLPPVEDEIFRSEYDRSMEALEDLQRTIDQQRPLSRIERLERLRDQAVSEENYELAARLRDRIAALRSRGQQQIPP